MNIAVDAMGGDNAPEVVVQGAFEASIEMGIDVTLVGRRGVIRDALNGKRDLNYIHVHHCDEVILMDEPPLKAVRKKKDASIRVAFELMKEKKVDAVVSAGNSGASLAAGLLTVGKIKGIERPALASIFPGEKGKVILIDVGANVDCRPLHLFQFGVMGHAFATSCLGMDDPKVGLLSIGEEGSKGNEQVKSAHDLFRESHLNFAGNVEGRDIFTGQVQVVVSDGFVGNVALKLTEGMAEAMTHMLQEYLMGSLSGRVGLFFGRKSLNRFKKKLDYAEYGGAPILGIKGVGIICHGSSSARAIKNAVKMAASYVSNNIEERLTQKMAKP